MCPLQAWYVEALKTYAVKDGIEDPTGRLIRLIKYMAGELNELINPCVQEPTHLGYKRCYWKSDREIHMECKHFTERK